MIPNPELAPFIPEETPEAGVGSHPDDQTEQESQIAVIPGESLAEKPSKNRPIADSQ